MSFENQQEKTETPLLTQIKQTQEDLSNTKGFSELAKGINFQAKFNLAMEKLNEDVKSGKLEEAKAKRALEKIKSTISDWKTFSNKDLYFGILTKNIDYILNWQPKK